MSDLEYSYILDVIEPKELAQKFEVENEASFGSSRDTDLAITGQGLSPLQGKFRYQNEILTYTQMSADEIIKIGSQTCKKGRMYILEKGDRITTEKKDNKEEKLKIIIRKEEVTNKNSEAIEDIDLDDEEESDRTDTNIIHDMTGIFKNPNQKGIKKLFTKGYDYSREKFLDFIEFIRELNFKKIKEATQVGFKLRRDQMKPAPKQKGKKVQDPVSGLLPRFLGMFYNILIFVLFYFQGLPALEEITDIKFSTFSKELFDTLVPYFNQIPAQIEAIPYTEVLLPAIKTHITSYEQFNLFALFVTYELICHMIFGVGFGQFILGLRAKGNFFLVRILSPIRLLIYFLTSPLLILDLPIIINKKSLKETLTLTSIISKSKKAMAFNTIIVLPIILILFCNYETLLYLISGNPVVANEAVDIKAAKAREDKGEVLFKLDLPSLQLHAKAAINLNEIIIPTVTQNKSDYSVKMIFYKPKEESTIRIHQSRAIIEAKELYSILRQDPLNLGAFDLYTGDDISLPITTAQNITESFYQIITFNPEDPLPLLEKVGPVTNPYQKIFRKTLEKVGMTAVDKSLLLKGTHQHMITLERRKSSYQISLLHFTSKGLMETLFEFDPKLRKSAIDLINKSWAVGKPGEQEQFGVELITKLPAEQKPNIILGAFSSLNTLDKIIRSQELSNREISNLTNTFLQLSFHSLKTDDQMLQNTLLDELEVLDKWLLVYDKKNKKQSLSELRLGLLRIQKALSGRNEEFFKLNK